MSTLGGVPGRRARASGHDRRPGAYPATSGRNRTKPVIEPVRSRGRSPRSGRPTGSVDVRDVRYRPRPHRPLVAARSGGGAVGSAGGAGRADALVVVQPPPLRTGAHVAGRARSPAVPVATRYGTASTAAT